MPRPPPYERIKNKAALYEEDAAYEQAVIAVRSKNAEKIFDDIMGVLVKLDT